MVSNEVVGELFLLLILRWPFAVALFVALFTSGAEATKQSLYDPGRYITEKRIQEVHDAFRDLVRPEKSPLSMVDAREIVTFGTFSAMAQSCGLPWEEQIFLPMMFHYRHERNLNEQHMKFVGILHGVQQGTVLKALSTGACTPEIREFLIENLRLRVSR